ncbi:MAG: beta-ketoacyl-[acyl-carrier-protein] synthase family protein [Verrucomicrobiaceae bacterium]
MIERRRIVVTGIGVVSAIGSSRDEFWRALASGTTGIAPLDPPEPDIGFTQVAAVRGFDPERLFESRIHQGMDRSAQFALAAANEAIADSGLVFDDEAKSRAGVITGCGIGGAITQDVFYERLYRQDKKRFPPTIVPNVMPNAGASHISMHHGLRGPAFTISSACASSAHALGMALWLLRMGAMDAAVAGGSEAMLNTGCLRAWDALRVVSPTTCKPFSAERNGMILGEGGAMLVLEPLDAAQARGTRIYAELAGFGMTADAHHLTAPSLDGPASAMRAALADACLDPLEIDYINAHGTGTPGNDANEVRAICEVFGDHANHLAISSTKSMHGHTIGAAGAIEAVATVLSIHHGILPPTLNCTPLDPDCAIDVVADHARPAVIRSALSNSFAFGGLNAVLAFRGTAP